MRRLSTLLAAARKRKNLTLRAAEKATGISNAYLSQLENDEIQEPSPVMLSKLAKLYEVPYGTLLELAGYPVPGHENPKQGNLAARFGPLSEEEETALLDYLNFLRTKRRPGRKP